MNELKAIEKQAKAMLKDGDFKGLASLRDKLTKLADKIDDMIIDNEPEPEDDEE